MRIEVAVLLILIIFAIGCTEEAVRKGAAGSPSSQMQAVNASTGPDNYLPDDLTADQLDKSIEELEAIG